MTMATTETPPRENLPAIHPPRLPYHPAVEERFGIDRASWKALVEAIFPTASSTESVILALSYCRARKLDPFKRNVHIVPIWNRELKRMVDSVWPGIGELRTTAFRTGDYAGRDAAAFGPDLTQDVGRVSITFPEWAQVTVYRMVKGQRVAFAGPRVYWLETYATVKRDDDTPNEMWLTRKRGQIEKCAEAASLRAAFPEEIGSEYIAEEVQHQRAKEVASKPVDDRNRGAAALADRITHALPDTQLTEAEAEAVIQRKAAQANVSPSRPPAESEAETGLPAGEGADVADANDVEPEPPEDDAQWPSHLPDFARKGMGWMNDRIVLRKGGLTAHEARKRFAAMHAPHSWEKLAPEIQDALYESLRSGEDVFGE